MTMELTIILGVDPEQLRGILMRILMVAGLLFNPVRSGAVDDLSGVSSTGVRSISTPRTCRLDNRE
jgi:hypothetical protein